MRGVAAVVVVLRHAVAIKPFDPLPHAGLAVDFFFVLSGFVIAHAYERKLADGGMSFGEFVRIRLIRLYPLLALGAALAAAVLLAELAAARDPGDTARGVIYALGSFVILPLSTGPLAPPDYFGDTVFLNSPEWSLFYELAINVVYAAIAVRLTNRRLLAVIALAALWLLLQPLYLGHVAADWFTFASGPPRVLFSFNAGVLLFRLHHNHRPQQGPLSSAFLALALVVCLLSPGRYGDLAGVALTLGALPAIVWLAASADLAPWARRLSDWAGRLSYPVYILHLPLLRLLNPSLGRLLGPFAHSPATLLIQVAAIVSLSAIALLGFDQPVRRWLIRPGGSNVRPAAA